MARPLRIAFHGAWYHVMNRGINRNNLFFNDGQKHVFQTLLSKTIAIYGIEIHAYCLMDNHYHLIVHTPRGNISQAMKYLNSNYAQFINKCMRRDGPLFKSRFKAIVVSADDYLITLSRYIHLNPVRAKIVNDIDEYLWSSYTAYIDKHQKPEWLCTDEIIKRFGKKNFSKNYIKYVRSSFDKTSDDFFNQNKYKPVIGNDDFCKVIDDLIKSNTLSTEIVGDKLILTPPSIESIIKDVASYFNIKPEKIFHSSPGVKNHARSIAIYVCRELGGFQLREIGKAMGGVTYKGISNAIYRIKSDKNQLRLANFLAKKIKRNDRTALISKNISSIT